MMAETSFASVICGTETLVESDYMSVNENDVIGVGVPSSDPLRVVASSAAGYTLQMIGTTGATFIDSSQLQMQNNYALHLAADISKELVVHSLPPLTLGTSFP